jgi:hypothetical protein
MFTALNYRSIARDRNERPLRQIAYPQLVDLLQVPRTEAGGYYLKIRQLAVEELLAARSKQTLEECPLQEGAVLAMVGQSTFKATPLKARLAQLGILYKGTVNKETTHVLIGRSPTTIKGLAQHQVTFLNDKLLQQRLDELERPYLLKKNETTCNTISHLSDLLMSTEVSNILLGIEIIKGGGFPKELIPQAFWAMKSSRNKTVYKELKNVLDKYLSPEGRKAIRKTFSVSIQTPESKLTKKLAVFCNHAPDLDGLEVAKQLFRYYQKGMQYIWRCSEDSPLKKQVLETFIRGEILDLQDKGLSVLPRQLSNYPQIKKALLRGNRFATVPPVLSKLPNLEYLDLSYNSRMRQLSPRLLAMSKLRYLNLYGNFPYWNSPRVRELVQLEKLVLRNWPHYHGPNSPEVIRRAMPNCELLLLP